MIKLSSDIGIKVVLLLILVFTAFYLFAIYSAPYEAAKKFTQDVEVNNKISQVIGNVQSVTLPFLGPYSYKTGSGSQAQFELNVVGEKAGRIFLRLQNEQGGWKVIGAFLVTKDNKLTVLLDDPSN